ncbi:MAG TPA: carboxypeptidase regulatory-like domain-containing protein, partial [Candidatus Baltobacteraceae bacterium]
TGRVIDATTNRPIPNALVSVGSLYTAYADSQGAFLLSTIPVGPQIVTARSSGYVSNTLKARVKKDVTTSAGYITLMPVVVNGSYDVGTPAPRPPLLPTDTPAPTPTP